MNSTKRRPHDFPKLASRMNFFPNFKLGIFPEKKIFGKILSRIFFPKNTVSQKKTLPKVENSNGRFLENTFSRNQQFPEAQISERYISENGNFPKPNNSRKQIYRKTRNSFGPKNPFSPLVRFAYSSFWPQTPSVFTVYRGLLAQNEEQSTKPMVKISQIKYTLVSGHPGHTFEQRQTYCLHEASKLILD